MIDRFGDSLLWSSPESGRRGSPIVGFPPVVGNENGPSLGPGPFRTHPAVRAGLGGGRGWSQVALG